MNNLFTAALLAVSLVTSAAVPASAERTLRLSLQVAVNHPVGKNIVFFKDELERFPAAP